MTVRKIALIGSCADAIMALSNPPNAKEFQLSETISDRPAFEGLVLMQDTEWRYHFWYPKGWHRYELTAGREGVLCSPQAEDPSTFFSVHVVKLATAVGPDDVDVLQEGIEEGLSQLPGLNVELAQSSQAAGQITFERVYTFVDGAATRKRRIRLIYAGNRLYSLMSQGSSVDEYEHWLSMLHYCHLTFRLGLFDPTQVN
jgi:hypothetical protein